MIKNENDLVNALDADTETEHLEFKEAKNRYDFDELTKYCCALANEGGGSIILGVTDKRPREVVGSSAFSPPDSQKQALFQRLHWRIDITEFSCSGKRVLIFNVPGRPSGLPLHFDGRYWMRIGSELRPMSPEQLTYILREATPDYSAEVAEGATLNSLDPFAVSRFRTLWSKKAVKPEILLLSDLEVLENSELMVEGRVTYAALILMGSTSSLSRFLAQCETIFEYRNAESSINYQQRQEYRAGFLLWSEHIWEQINLRNEIQQFRNGLIRFDIPVFGEDSIREAILNAVSHREYRDGGSIWVRQFPKTIEINSPGGFPQGVNASNILNRQKPRNRRLAEALARCGFVERSGQGADLMFRQSISQSKPLPDYSSSDPDIVSLKLSGEVQDKKFVEFLEKVGSEKTSTFTTNDFLVIDLVHKGELIPPRLADRAKSMADIGVIEQAGRGKYILSRSFYVHLGKPGTYTRKKGLDVGTERELLYKHIRDARIGAPVSELLQVLPSRPRAYVKRILSELREAGRVHCRGVTRAGRWFAGPDPQRSEPLESSQQKSQ